MPSFASTLKAHHASLNSAFAAYYAPGSARPSVDSSRTSSTSSSKSSTSALASPRTEPTDLPPRNITRFTNAIKQHHADLNNAYATYYAPGSSVSSSSAPASSASSTTSANSSRTVGPSFEEEWVRQQRESTTPRKYERLWGAVKGKASRHHEGVNAAASKVYGI